MKKRRSITCEESLWLRAAIHAKKEDRSLSNLFCRALKIYLDRIEENGGA